MEKYKKGGYTILDLESSTIYADSVKALDSNKPIVVYDGTNAPYFADSISLSGTSVVITKGGKTITIANDNTITNVGDIQLTTLEIDISVDDYSATTDFDDYIITEDLYNKLLSGKYILKTNLYDSVGFIGFPNWVNDDSQNVFTNNLVYEQNLLFYFDTSDKALCAVILGKLKDDRYFIVCDSNTMEIINA